MSAYTKEHIRAPQEDKCLGRMGDRVILVLNLRNE